MTREQAESLTDRQADEWYFQAYDKPSPEEAWQRQEEANRAAVDAFAAKTLEERRKEHEAFCRGWSFTPEQIAAAWKKYLDTGRM